MASGTWQADRVRSATTTIFAEMSALALATRSVNLGPGFPGHRRSRFHAGRGPGGDRRRRQPVPARSRDSATAGGDRRAHQRAHYGLSYDPDSEVLVTTGATEALAAAILAFVDPGDEVIALEPFYDSYAASIDLAGGGGWGSVCSDRTFAWTTPSWRLPSPTRPRLADQLPAQPDRHGARSGRSGRDRRLAVQHDVLVICDEVYEHLVFDDAEHLPLAGFPGMRERTVRISSAGKTFSATGWKIGWVLAPPSWCRGHRRQAVPDLRLRRARSSPPSPGRWTRATTGWPGPG